MSEIKSYICSIVITQKPFTLMLKRFVLTVSMLLVVTSVAAQSYNSLWKSVEKDLSLDKPKSALTNLQKIQQKAEKDGNDVQLLRAMQVSRQMHLDISPDSGRVALWRMEKALERTTKPVERALWLSLLGQTYIDKYNYSRWRWREAEDTASLERGRALLLQSVADIEALGRAKAKDYVPLFVIEKCSKVYGHDVLSVLADAVLSSEHISGTQKQRLRNELTAWYAARKAREAVLLLRLDSIDAAYAARDRLEQQTDFIALRATAREFQDLQLNVETYIALTKISGRGTDRYNDSIRVGLALEGLALYGKEPRANELRRFIAEKERPRFSMRASSQTLYPGDEMRLAMNGNNVREVTLDVFRTPWQSKDLRFKNTDDYKALCTGAPYRTLQHDLGERPAYAEFKDTIGLVLSDAGIYVVRLATDNAPTRYEVLSVSALRPMILKVDGGANRLTPVDMHKGTPRMGGTVDVFSIVYPKNAEPYLRFDNTYTADARGDIYLPTDERRNLVYQLRVGGDAAAPLFDVSNYVYNPANDRVHTDRELRTYTDREIYRPGQTVHFAAVCYEKEADSVRVLTGEVLNVDLVNASYKVEETVELTTDEFGTLSHDFVLPESCMPGTFTLRVRGTGDLSGQHTVRVEEYKRPTFTVTIEQPSYAYKLGDSIYVSGKAETYSGVPVERAKVKYKVRRSYYYDFESKDLAEGELQTDSTGQFRIPVFLEKGSEKVWWRSFYRYVISADVTSESGETRSDGLIIYATERDSWLEIDWPSTINRDHPRPVCVSRYNAPGKNLPTRGEYEILFQNRRIEADTLLTGTPFTPAMFRTQPSGRYKVRVTVGDFPTDSVEFLLFSESDTLPFTSETMCSYVRQSAEKDSAYVMIGSELRDVTLFYDIISNHKVVRSERIAFSDSLLHFNIAYQPAWGDGASCVFAFERNGSVYSKTVRIVKPRPDKRLKMQWQTFRSYLTPGAKEEWRLRVVRPDGTPADASMMARLYDASLDQLVQRPWSFGLSFPRTLSQASWRVPSTSSFSLSAYADMPTWDSKELSFSHWNSTYTSYFFNFNRIENLTSAAGERKLNKSSAHLNVGYAEEPEAMMDGMVATQALAEVAVEGDASGDGGTSEEGDVPLRQNFDETAFFAPALRTAADGGVDLVFTLPESLTTWRFQGFAHDRTMNYGLCDTTAIARKEFMVQSALPRFLRSGDVTQLPATLTNLTGKPVSGTATCQLLDARTGKQLAKLSQPFRLEGTTSVVRFAYTAPADIPVLICRISAKGGTFADGEERYLPVLEDKVQVVRSVPFSLTDEGSFDLKIDTLWTDARRATGKRLIVEASSNPAWYAVGALPPLVNETCYSSTAWAARYYALALAGHIADTYPEIAAAAQRGDTDAFTKVLERNPDLKQTLLAESPWATDANDEAARAEELARLLDETLRAGRMSTALDKLGELQLSDGSWSWFGGMTGSPYITTQVAVMLARLQAMTGNKAADSKLRRAMSYLEKETAEDVKEMKKLEKKYKFTFSGSEQQLQYLYLRALLGMQPNKDAKYLLGKFVDESFGTMYSKAATAVVLAQYGKHKAARRNIESLLEHTVSRAGQGMWFDTDRALWCWNAYKIPTQTASVEALRLLGGGSTVFSGDEELKPNKEFLKAADEMCLWLMQSRRTQGWPTNRAVTDAIYALLGEPDEAQELSASEYGPALRFTLKKGSKTLATIGRDKAQADQSVGYFRQDYTDAATLGADNLRVTKMAKGLSWGSIYAQFCVPADDVSQTGNGLTLVRKMEVQRGTKWVAINTGDKLQQGDRVRQVFTISADRDYDYVSLRAARAACMEPADQLSGYHYRDGLWFYRVSRDASNEYFFEKLHKGTHTFTEEAFIDRAGTYLVGTAAIQSQYAPEFGGTAPGLRLTVE